MMDKEDENEIGKSLLKAHLECVKRRNEIEKKENRMATTDVPGAKASNGDKLGIGCWAEHEDQSLILVEGIEGNRVIYSIFDKSTDPITEYRDAMLIDTFKKQFSWDPKNAASEKWVWHDKTTFPWNRIIKAGAKDGVRFASVDDQLSAAKRVAKSRKLKGEVIEEDDVKHMVDVEKPKGLIERLIVEKIQKALDKLLV